MVDDDAGVRDYVGALLTRSGLEVTEASDGEQGLRSLDEHRPDLVLLDVDMPGAGGLEILRCIKQRNGWLPVVMLSGHNQTPNVVESMRRGASDFVAKPFEPDALRAAVLRALALPPAPPLCPTCQGTGRTP